jgi:hypothetical protein
MYKTLSVCSALLVTEEVEHLYKKTVRTKKVLCLFLNNQPDALIIQILFCYKTLHISGNLFAHHQEFSTVRSALVSFMQVFDDRFQAESVPS